MGTVVLANLWSEQSVVYIYQSIVEKFTFLRIDFNRPQNIYWCAVRGFYVLLLAANPCHFLFLDKKKVTKEKSRLQRILGLLFFVLPTQYNSLSANWRIAQTVLLTAGPAASLKTVAISQNSLRLPFFGSFFGRAKNEQNKFQDKESNITYQLQIKNIPNI